MGNAETNETPAYASIRVSDDCSNWKHTGPEQTPDEIAAYYRDASYHALGYSAQPEKDSTVTITVELLNEDDDILGTHDIVTVSIPADHRADW